MTVNKKDVIKLLETIAIYMELKGDNPFKISAFRKAAQALEIDDRSLSAIEDFTTLSGIGKGTASVIKEFIDTGGSETLNQLKQEVPEGLIQLLKIQGLGGKKIAKLYKELGVEDVESLKQACALGKVQVLAGFGKKTEEKILASLEDAGKRPDRLPIAFMASVAKKVEEAISQMQDVVRYSRAGSLRRMKETIKDLDFIIATNNPLNVSKQLLSLNNIKAIISNGETKISLLLEDVYDVSVDFRLVEPEQFATTLHHFTGSKEHNVKLRQLAKERGEKINEYGIEIIRTKELITFESEEQFFQHFGFPLIPPEIREDGSELDLYREEQSLVSLSDIRGDLHMHSTWSDGAYSITEMAEAAQAKGYEYIAITDHSQFLKVANGLSPERLIAQRKEINHLNEQYKGKFHIFAGVEMDILPDSTLDYDESLLKEMDIVIASIHSGFSQSRQQIMQRLKNALISAHVDVIAHPTGRVIGRRNGYDVDIELLIQLAKETNTALELNANPNRLDLSAQHIKKAHDAGVNVIINTDAHNIEMLDDMIYGIATARKGWVKKENVVNTWDVDRVMAFLRRND